MISGLERESLEREGRKGPDVIRHLVLLALVTVFALPAAAGDVYDPTGKRDPFRSPLIEDPELPRTGGLLAEWELSRLRLVAVGNVVPQAGKGERSSPSLAVAGTPEGRFALIEPPKGPGALLLPGSRVGKEQAEVILVGADRVVLRQERRLLTGSLFVDYELRLEGPVTSFPTPAPGP